MSEDHTEAPRSRRVLPVVVDMCHLVNDAFTRYVGPIADEIAGEIYEHWLHEGDTGPSGVSRYIQLLARNIVDENQRSSFIEEAHSAMRKALERRS